MPHPFDDTWVVLPTYDEADNLEGISGAILERLPGATLLVVDDNSPDGTGRLADDLATRNSRIRVRHRQRKEGLGRAYVEGFRVALDAGAARIVQMDADWSHHPDYLPALLGALDGGPGAPRPDGADLVIGSRYARGGGVENWQLMRRLVSRAGCEYARRVLRVPVRDLTGGFKCFRAETLRTIDYASVRSQGYGFQVELTYRALQRGLRVAELPIVFRERREGQSKMTWRIAAEAAFMVPRLRADARSR